MNKILLIQNFNTITIQLQLQNVIWLSKENFKRRKKKHENSFFFLSYF